jgi:hypothetical protein
MSIAKRMRAPTPKFFRVLRTIGIALATAGGTLLAAPIAVPAIVLTIAGYATVAGSVLTAVSQATVENETIAEKQPEE